MIQNITVLGAVKPKQTKKTDHDFSTWLNVCSIVLTIMNVALVAAILTTGGYNAAGGLPGLQSAEVFLPATAASCQLAASLELARESHSQAGLLACGGTFNSEAATSCEQFSPATGAWARTSHSLQVYREGHVCWSVEQEGTILMGGLLGYTSEIMKHDGTTERSFDMKYITR